MPDPWGYYDRQGNPIDMYRAAELRSDPNYKVVAVGRITGPEIDIAISTVWLGLDHNWGDGPPLIFETLIFGGTLDGAMWRYPTEQAALEGHAEAVAIVQLEAQYGAQCE